MKDIRSLPTLQCPRLSIALLSAAALAYEVLLMRLFAIIQFHHFAYMIISLALLGYGASGTFLSMARETLLRRFGFFYPSAILLFSLSLIVCFQAGQSVAFNPEEILWTPSPFVRLFLIYILLSLPFFFAANAIALALAKFPGHISRIYAFDLIGAGSGSLTIIFLLFCFFPQKILFILSWLVFCAFLVSLLESGIKQLQIILLLIASFLFLFLPPEWIQLNISPYKALSQQLLISGSKIIEQRSSPYGLLTVVENKYVPLRNAPGLSLLATNPPPDQLAVFTDGDSITAINKGSSNRKDYQYLDFTTSALGYHLKHPGNVLILGVGGGNDILQARYHFTPQIDAVELNPQMADLLQNRFKTYSGNLFSAPGTTVFTGDARGFITRTKKRYDMIMLSLIDSFAASSAGLYALSENYLYTVEAFQEYLKHLTDDGYLSVSRWVKLPPRDSLKLIATAALALEKNGIDAPGQRLVMIRSWQTTTMLVKNSPVTNKEIQVLKSFCADRSFDLVYYPGMSATEANQYNVLEQPFFSSGAARILDQEQRTSYLSRYKFEIGAATDDKPFFNHFFKWRLLREIVSLYDQGGMALVESGYLVLAVTLIQSIAASVLLILLPLLFFKRRSSKSCHKRGTTWRIFVYFFSIGLAFLFLEIAFIQKFILFLSNPLYAVTAVLTAFLLFAGIGSGFSQKILKKNRFQTGIFLPVGGIVCFGALYLVLLGYIFRPLMDLPDTLKIVVSILLIAPLAFWMGMPFPAGLAAVGETRPQLLPWAWGINGCASVISAVLATICAIHFGFTAVVICALLLYSAAALHFPKQG